MVKRIRNMMLSFTPIKYLVFWARYLVPKPIKFVEIETTSACNLSCKYCPNFTAEQSGLLRQKKLMTESLYKRIVDDLSSIRFRGRFSPHFYGEPLLDKRLPHFVSYAKQKLPGAMIQIFTNGELLNVEILKKLIEAGMDAIKICQHTNTPNSNRDAALAFVKRELPDYFRNSVEYVDIINANDFYFTNRGGLVNVNELPTPKEKLVSCKLAQGLTIDVEGNVVLCCNDYYSKHKFGNLAEMKIKELWHQKNYRKVRALTKAGFWPTEMCKICVELNYEEPQKQGFKV